MMAMVDYMVLADAATAAEGKLYIHGAGWDTIFAASFPYQLPQISVAIRVRVPWNETNQAHKIELDVLDQDGVSIVPEDRLLKGDLSAGRPLQLPQGEDQTFSFVINLAGLQFDKPGNYIVVFRLDEQEVARSPFRIVVPTLNVSMAAPSATPPAA